MITDSIIVLYKKFLFTWRLKRQLFAAIIKPVIKYNKNSRYFRIITICVAISVAVCKNT
jgi:hypothetical protein